MLHYTFKSEWYTYINLEIWISKQREKMQLQIYRKTHKVTNLEATFDFILTS